MLAAGGPAEEVNEGGEADGGVGFAVAAAGFVGANFEAQAKGASAVQWRGGQGQPIEAPLFGGIGGEVGYGSAGLAGIFGGELDDGEALCP